MALRIIALVPAFNEAGSIAATIEALLAQTRIPDRIVVIPNGCSDNTAEIAREYANVSPSVIVLEFPKLEHKKSEALNIGWNLYGRVADIVICIDADTVLPPNALNDWEKEFTEAAALGQKLGGSSSKFTMLGGDFWTRLQRSEFAKWTDSALLRGYTTVLAGTGCAISGAALRQVVDETNRPGPWSYGSQVEDFELTFQLRLRGWKCQVSPTVRAYTDSMKSFKALWGQRMKWQVGTVEDLLRIGVNRYTLLDWRQQVVGMTMALVRVLWVVLLVALGITGQLYFSVIWWVALPLVFAAGEFILSFRIPHADRLDHVYAAMVVPAEIFAWVRAAWFVKAWAEVLSAKLFKTGPKDRWLLQYAAEAITSTQREEG